MHVLTILAVLAVGQVVTWQDVANNWLEQGVCYADLNDDKIVNYRDFAGSLKAVEMTDIYVSTIGNDTWDGSSPVFVSGTTGPVATIQKAISIASSNDIISVQPGTYNETQFNHLYFYDAVFGRKTNVVIKAYDSNNKPVIATGATSNGSMILSLLTTGNDASIIFEDIVFAPTGQDYSGVYNNGALSLTFRRCVLSLANNYGYLVWFRDTDAKWSRANLPIRDIVFEDCTIGACDRVVYTENARLISLKNINFAGQVDEYVVKAGKNLDSCVLINFETSMSAGAMSHIFGAVGGLEGPRSTFIARNIKGSNLNTGILFKGYTKFVDIDNVDVTTNVASSSGGIMLGVNDQVDWDVATSYSEYDYAMQDRRMFRCISAPAVGDSQPLYSADWQSYWELVDFGAVTVSNCNVEHLQAGAGHSYILGKGCNAVDFYNNQGKDGDFQLVIKSDHNKIHNCIMVGPSSYYLNGGQRNVIGNCVGYATSGSALLYGESQDETTPEDNWVYNSIFDASAGGQYAVRFNIDDGIYYHWNNRENNNCYVAGTLALAFFDGVNYNTVEEMRTKWLSWLTYWSDNDQSSLDNEPQFRDAANGDYTPLNSDLLTAGIDGGCIGAVQNACLYNSIYKSNDLYDSGINNLYGN